MSAWVPGTLPRPSIQPPEDYYVIDAPGKEVEVEVDVCDMLAENMLLQ